MARGDTNRNLVAALSYLLGFVTGIVVLLVEKEDKFIRFHAMQSTVIFGSLFVLNILISVFLKPFSVIGTLAKLVDVLISVCAVVIWIVSMIRAYKGQMFKWPIAGDFAEKQVG